MFTICLQYIQKEANDEINLLHADKQESLGKIDTMIFMRMVKNSQSSQNIKFAMSLHYIKKEVSDEFDFNTLDLKASYKVI